MLAYGLALTLDHMDVAAYDTAVGASSRIAFGAEQGATLRLGLSGTDTVEHACWGVAEGAPSPQGTWHIFEDVVADLCRIWQLPARSAIVDELMRLLLANVPQQMPVLLTCSPQIPRTVRHGLLTWMRTHRYCCVPLTDPWAVLCCDFWLRQPADRGDDGRIVVFLQDRYEVTTAVVRCHRHCLSAPNNTSYVDCCLEHLVRETVHNSEQQRPLDMPATPALQDISRDDGLWLVLLGCGDSSLHSHVASCALSAGLKLAQVIQLSREELAEAAARVAAYAAHNLQEQIVLRWQQSHQLGWIDADGQAQPLLATELEETRGSSSRLKHPRDRLDLRMTIVDWPSLHVGSYVPVVDLQISAANAAECGAHTLLLSVEANGHGRARLIDAKGQLEHKSDFTLA